MPYSFASNRCRLSCVLFCSLLVSQSLSIFAQEEKDAEKFMSGASKTIQDAVVIKQEAGVDQKVKYAELMKYGPWDDRNYSITSDDMKMLPAEDQYMHNVPAFFKIYLRKQQPKLGKFYPRSAYQQFLIMHGGFFVNGKLYMEGLGVGYHGGRKKMQKTLNDEVILDLNLRGNEVSIEANPNNKLELVAGSNRQGGQTMYFSSDGGKTWQFSQTNPSSCCDPTIAWSKDGSKVYQADLSSSIGVRWAVSDDKGKTWGPMRVLTSSGSDKEFLHVDHSDSAHQDNIYLTYHNSNVMQFARSTDKGQSFETPISFDNAPRGIGSDITTDKLGHIYYVYPALGGEGITLLKSTDGGETFSQPKQIAALRGIFDFPIPAMETRRAFIYACADYDEKNDTIYVSWTDEADDSNVNSNSPSQRRGWIQVAKSSDGGETWSVVTRPHANDGQLNSSTPIDRFHPWITVEDGVVHVIYYDTRHSTNRSGVDLYYTSSKDGGATWEKELRFSSETSVNLNDAQEWGDYNGLSVVLDNVVASWTDNRRSNSPDADDKVAMVRSAQIGKIEPTADPSIIVIREEIEKIKESLRKVEEQLNEISNGEGDQ